MYSKIFQCPFKIKNKWSKMLPLTDAFKKRWWDSSPKNLLNLVLLKRLFYNNKEVLRCYLSYNKGKISKKHNFARLNKAIMCSYYDHG